MTPLEKHTDHGPGLSCNICDPEAYTTQRAFIAWARGLGATRVALDGILVEFGGDIAPPLDASPTAIWSRKP